MPLDGTVYLEPWQRVLLDAASRVRKAWSKGRFSGPGKAVCATYAIQSSDKGDDDARRRARFEVTRYLGTEAIMLWNDAPDITAEDVAGTMESVVFNAR